MVLVDRRHAPGGHWNDAYPFVRLHGPSALYGVNSRRLGSDVIEQDGPNAGFYPRATAAEICAYFRQVLDEVLLASGRVRFFGMSDCPIAGGRARVHLPADRGDDHGPGAEAGRGRRYLEPSIPATHVPPFGVEPGTRLIPVNNLVRAERAGRAGSRSSEAARPRSTRACGFSSAGVPPDAIRWVRPRDPWLLDRAFQQPLALLPG